MWRSVDRPQAVPPPAKPARQTLTPWAAGARRAAVRRLTVTRSRQVCRAGFAGRGTVYTWTIVRGPTLPAFETELPYNVVDVLMDEGVHFVSQVLDCPPEEIRAGMPVEAVFVPASEEITLVKFRRAG